MAVAITVDQSGKPPGVAGKAREDLATGTGITLTSSGGPFLAYQWRIVHKPINIITPARSAALLASPSAPTTVLTPINISGTHLIELSVDSGAGLGASPGDIARISFYAGPTLAADPTQLPRRKPAAFEALEHNVNDALDPSGNPDGWAREWLRWFATVEALVPVRGWAAAKMILSTGTARRPSLSVSSGTMTSSHPCRRACSIQG